MALLLTEPVPDPMTINSQPSGSRSPLGDDSSSDRTTASDHTIGNGDSIEHLYYGDFIGYDPKTPHTFRGVSCQLGGLPTDHRGSKHLDLITAFKDYDMDMVAIQEVGINFNYPGIYGSWRQRLGWNTWLDGRSTKTVNAWNSHQRNRQRHQYGGTAIITRGRTSFYSAGSGIDPSKLGRWCWSRYQGQNGVFLRVISFYRPCEKGNSPGALSVHAQHRQYLYSQDDDRAPRDAFLEDLAEAIHAWTALGDQLIVCGDINEDVLSTPITDFFTGLGLRNLIFSRHDSAQAPATCYRNQSGISIDGVWASPTLDLVRGGYLERGDFPGDHRPIWFEVSHVQAFGKSPPKLIKPQARRLQLRDPRCVARYQLKLKSNCYANIILPPASGSSKPTSPHPCPQLNSSNLTQSTQYTRHAKNLPNRNAASYGWEESNSLKLSSFRVSRSPSGNLSWLADVANT